MSLSIRFRLHRRARLALSLAAALLAATPALALRVVDYNLLNYPGSSGPARAPYYRTILGLLNADVIVTEEMASSSAPTEFLNEVLNVLEPGQWAAAPLIDGNDTDASVFYRTSAVQFLGQSAFYPNPANQLRLVHHFRLMPVNYSSPGAELRIYAAHLKASTGYESQRLAECTGIRDSMNAMPTGTHALLVGDMNFYTQSAETGYAKLIESETDNDGRMHDPLPAGAWHDGSSFAPYHTQSPCLSGGCASGAATGGMDDRFDMILGTYTLTTGQGFSLISGTCHAVGNDGQHLNKAITDSPTIPEGASYASALILASDHLPVRIDLQLPSRITTDPSLAFGTVIVGAPAPSLDLTIQNPAAAPADSLNCSFAPPSGFQAPGPLAVAPGSSAVASITMTTDSAHAGTPNLTIATDAPDNPTKVVALSGSVLRHAVASLDSTSVLLTGLADFGDHQSGNFGPVTVPVFNSGYDGLQARLAVNSATITGGGGHFNLGSGFTSILVGSPHQGFVVTFDDTGAQIDSVYSATLTFSTADEPYPGGTSQPDLVVSLRAQVINSEASTGEPAAPLATRLYEPRPNPMSGQTTVRLDLARPAEGVVAVFDPAGRRVAMLRQGALPAGHTSLSWNGRSDRGDLLGSGIYFIRLSARGQRTQVSRVTIVR